MKTVKENAAHWEEARERFVTHWGALGSQWGINRTMAQVHALLLTSHDPMSTDEVMEKLSISRGNAHTNLKELVSWGLIRMVSKKGERKDYFEAEKDIWKIFVMISKERRRREIEPALQVLRDCAEQTKDEHSAPGREFHRQMKELEDFVSLGIKVTDLISAMKHTSALQLAMRLMG